jgi:hypothetical protein
LIIQVLELNRPDPRDEVFEKVIHVGHDTNVATARAYLRMLLYVSSQAGTMLTRFSVENKVLVERPAVASNQVQDTNEPDERINSTTATAPGAQVALV